MNSFLNPREILEKSAEGKITCAAQQTSNAAGGVIMIDCQASPDDFFWLSTQGANAALAGEQVVIFGGGYPKQAFDASSSISIADSLVAFVQAIAADPRLTIDALKVVVSPIARILSHAGFALAALARGKIDNPFDFSALAAASGALVHRRILRELGADVCIHLRG